MASWCMACGSAHWFYDCIQESKTVDDGTVQQILEYMEYSTRQLELALRNAYPFTIFWYEG